MSHDGTQAFTAKTLLIDLLMGMIFLLLLSFSLWLIWITFFREHYDTGIIDSTSREYFQAAEGLQTNLERRFHNQEEHPSIRGESVSACIMCHEELAHSKSKETRAFLNAHSYFMACGVCHAKVESNVEVVYRWLDNETGQFSKSRPTNTTTKITPTINVSGSIKSLENTADKDFINDYLSNKDKLIDQQLKVVVERTHKNVLGTPIFCIDCHTMEKKPYLPFAQLTYTTARIDELTRIEIVGMIKKYEKFYMPDLSHENEN